MSYNVFLSYLYSVPIVFIIILYFDDFNRYCFKQQIYNKNTRLSRVL